MKKWMLVALLGLWGFAAGAQTVYNSSGGNRYTNKKKKEARAFSADKLIVGGGLSLGFGTITNLGISPIVGYRITDRFSAGIGLGYQYVRAKDFLVVPNLYSNSVSYEDFKSSLYSASVWTRYRVFDNIFAHVEYEHNFMSFNTYDTYDPASPTGYREEKIHYNAPSLLVGAGYRQPITDRASLVIIALYDVLNDPYSPYQGINFRFGFNLGF
jgi:opacity protein-like surface antigen